MQATQPLGDRLLRPGVHGQQGLHLLAGQGQAYEPAGNCAANMLQYAPICSNMLHNIRECTICPTKVGMPGGVDPVLRFMVKFYMPDPSQLEEEYTRYNLIMLLKKVNTLIMCMKFHYMSDHSQL